MNEVATIAPVRKTVIVDCRPEAGLRGLHRRGRELVADEDALDPPRQGHGRRARGPRGRRDVRARRGRQARALGARHGLGAAEAARPGLAGEPGDGRADRDRGHVHARGRGHPWSSSSTATGSRPARAPRRCATTTRAAGTSCWRRSPRRRLDAALRRLCRRSRSGCMLAPTGGRPARRAHWKRAARLPGSAARRRGRVACAVAAHRDLDHGGRGEPRPVHPQGHDRAGAVHQGRGRALARAPGRPQQERASASRSRSRRRPPTRRSARSSLMHRGERPLRARLLAPTRGPGPRARFAGGRARRAVGAGPARGRRARGARRAVERGVVPRRRARRLHARPAAARRDLGRRAAGGRDPLRARRPVAANRLKLVGPVASTPRAACPCRAGADRAVPDGELVDAGSGSTGPGRRVPAIRIAHGPSPAPTKMW